MRATECCNSECEECLAREEYVGRVRQESEDLLRLARNILNIVFERESCNPTSYQNGVDIGYATACFHAAQHLRWCIDEHTDRRTWPQFEDEVRRDYYGRENQ